MYLNRGNNLLWYKSGARSWNEALPLGNGRLGAMAYGGAERERVCLNEDTLWTGQPSFLDNPEALDAYKKSVDLVLQDRYGEAEKLLEQEGGNGTCVRWIIEQLGNLRAEKGPETAPARPSSGR